MLAGFVNQQQQIGAAAVNTVTRREEVTGIFDEASFILDSDTNFSSYN